LFFGCQASREFGRRGASLSQPQLGMEIKAMTVGGVAIAISLREARGA
jgi:hypothetical protein